jgi:hypothetical protein
MPAGVARNLSALARLIACASNGQSTVDLNGSIAARTLVACKAMENRLENGIET